MKAKRMNGKGEVALEVNDGDESLLKAGSTASFRLKKILVPIDFSECSAKALQYARAMAELHGASITLLHVVALQPYPGGEYGVIDLSAIEKEIEENAKTRLAAMAKDLRKDAAVDGLVRAGSAAAETIAVAEEIAADLIIISTHGYSGLKHVVMGSVAERVVRHAPCPVLVVRVNEHEFLA